MNHLIQCTYCVKTQDVITAVLYTLKNAGLFQPKFGSNMDKSKCWVENL